MLIGIDSLGMNAMSYTFIASRATIAWLGVLRIFTLMGATPLGIGKEVNAGPATFHPLRRAASVPWMGGTPACARVLPVATPPLDQRASRSELPPLQLVQPSSNGSWWSNATLKNRIRSQHPIRRGDAVKFSSAIIITRLAYAVHICNM